MRERKKPMSKERKYHRITWTERLIIEKQYNNGASYSDIARLLKRYPSSIRYEIKKGMYFHKDYLWRDIPRYSANIAQSKTEWEMTSKGQILKLGNNHRYAKYISSQIKQGHSPATIVETLRQQNKWTVSTPTLYRYIDQGLIPEITNQDLWEKSKRKRSYNKVRKAKRPPKGISIEDRPRYINTRRQFGHWEIDCVVGKKRGHGETLLTLTERKTRYEIIMKLYTRTAKEVAQALRAIVYKYPKGTFKTITVDNGSEFSDYETMKTIVPEIYYCHPYCSSERGTNERHNRIIRRFFPKKQSMKQVTQIDCEQVQAYMNTLPRKILNYASPEQRFTIEISNLIR